jgi:hypothetical protein
MLHLQYNNQPLMRGAYTDRYQSQTPDELTLSLLSIASNLLSN